VFLLAHSEPSCHGALEPPGGNARSLRRRSVCTRRRSICAGRRSVCGRRRSVDNWRPVDDRRGSGQRTADDRAADHGRAEAISPARTATARTAPAWTAAPAGADRTAAPAGGGAAVRCRSNRTAGTGPPMSLDPKVWRVIAWGGVSMGIAVRLQPLQPANLEFLFSG
jgi:hypothetical protein